MITYKFYTLDHNLNEQTFCLVNCKRPRMTKAYKQLYTMLNNNIINGFGYSINGYENNIININN